MPLTPKERRFLEARQADEAERLKYEQEEREKERIRNEMENRQYEIDEDRRRNNRR